MCGKERQLKEEFFFNWVEMLVFKQGDLLDLCLYALFGKGMKFKYFLCRAYHSTLCN